MPVELLDKCELGYLPTGEQIHSFTLQSTGGLSARVINLGGIITHLFVPDRNGQLDDVVLGFDRLSSYVEPHPFFGAMAGRVAGRISGGRFEIDGRAYQLERNDPPNHLHGGSRGFDKQVWNAAPVRRSDGAASLRLFRVSPDGEAGYPGNLSVSVTYTVTVDNRLLVEVEATADRATPFSLTQHSYFNLAGEGSGTIDGHELQIFSSHTAAIDSAFTLLGRKTSVAGRPADLHQPRRLGDVVPNLYDRHGDLYFVEPSPNSSLRSCAQLSEPFSGRRLTVSTTEDCLQFYTGVRLDGTLIGKSGRPYAQFAGLCLECEGYPDGANVPELGNIILRPGQNRRQITEYAFTTF
jgi:aldose 1-epimerase